MHHLEEVEDRFITIGDRDTLSLGDKTLKFYLAPWVHWPDTRFTEVVEDNVLFTTDIIGTHSAAAALCRDVESSDYLVTAKRHCTAIMTPFRCSVQDHHQLLD